MSRVRRRETFDYGQQVFIAQEGEEEDATEWNAGGFLDGVFLQSDRENNYVKV